MGVWRREVGLRSLEVRRGLLYLNNRRIQVRGASIHEDMPGHGAGLTGADNARIVGDLESLGANVTRAHYLLNEDLLRRLDRAGIMVWNQAPIWQRDHGANLLRTTGRRRRALRTVKRTVLWGRNHPSVITHSVANELSFTPDSRPGTRPFLTAAANAARDLDPTLPISVDVKGRPGFPEQFVYLKFDMLGINQYFGWYSWVADFETLEPYLREMRDIYPDLALVMTEFGAEGRPNQRDEPIDQPGSWAYQAFHAEPHPGGRRSPALAVGRDLLDPAGVRDLPRLDGRTGLPRDSRRSPQHAPLQGPDDLRRRAQARLLRGSRPLRRGAALRDREPAQPLTHHLDGLRVVVDQHVPAAELGGHRPERAAAGEEVEAPVAGAAARLHEPAHERPRASASDSRSSPRRWSGRSCAR